MDILNIVGVLASILGATIAIYQCAKASDAAKLAINAKESAINARNEIAMKKDAIELTALLSETKRIEQLLIKYTSDKEDKLKGVNPDEDTNTIQTFISSYNEIKSKTKGDLRIFLDNNYLLLNQDSYKLPLLQVSDTRILLDNFRDLTSKLAEEINGNTFNINTGR